MPRGKPPWILCGIGTTLLGRTWTEIPISFPRHHHLLTSPVRGRSSYSLVGTVFLFSCRPAALAHKRIIQCSGRCIGFLKFTQPPAA
ncbi:hypothetical protein CPB83DRAFT_641030 [Crepidotus variabilis]|uniref:Uncharacterized protein n=1 Tax=Crepidotus variabilis TaxID=179855 RepID=A0A9P6E7P7_9AGAR|nr:hypothetical protein CPB83DRAFT_641030 [Crepidotus variabilis]